MLLSNCRRPSLLFGYAIVAAAGDGCCTWTCTAKAELTEIQSAKPCKEGRRIFPDSMSNTVSVPGKDLTGQVWDKSAQPFQTNTIGFFSRFAVSINPRIPWRTDTRCSENRVPHRPSRPRTSCSRAGNRASSMTSPE